MLQDMVLFLRKKIMYTSETNKPTKFEFDIINCYRDKNYFFKYNILTGRQNENQAVKYYNILHNGNCLCWPII